MATLAIEVSSASMKVASVTVMAMTQGLARGRHVSWNEAVAAAAKGGFFSCEMEGDWLLRCQQSNGCERE
jgi:hypothetical protein